MENSANGALAAHGFCASKLQAAVRAAAIVRLMRIRSLEIITSVLVLVSASILGANDPESVPSNWLRCRLNSGLSSSATQS